MRCDKCGHEIGEWLKIPELGIEVEIKVHDKGKSYNELNLKDKEDMLLDINEVIFLANNPEYSKILKMDGSSSFDDFIFKQPLDKNRKLGYIALWFYYPRGRSDLCCWGRGLDDFSNAFGVRFKRKLLEVKA